MLKQKSRGQQLFEALEKSYNDQNPDYKMVDWDILPDIEDYDYYEVAANILYDEWVREK